MVENRCPQCDTSLDARRGDLKKRRIPFRWPLDCFSAQRQGRRNPTSMAVGDALSLYDSNGRITCAEACEHGIAPVYSDHPAYPYKRNPDADRVVCEWVCWRPPGPASPWRRKP